MSGRDATTATTLDLHLCLCVCVSCRHDKGLDHKYQWKGNDASESQSTCQHSLGISTATTIGLNGMPACSKTDGALAHLTVKSVLQKVQDCSWSQQGANVKFITVSLHVSQRHHNEWNSQTNPSNYKQISHQASTLSCTKSTGEYLHSRN